MVFSYFLLLFLLKFYDKRTKNVYFKSQMENVEGKSLVIQKVLFLHYHLNIVKAFV